MEDSTFAWLSLRDGGRLQSQRTEHLMILSPVPIGPVPTMIPSGWRQTSV